MNRRSFLKRTGVTAAGVVAVPTVVVKEMCTSVPVESFSPEKIRWVNIDGAAYWYENTMVEIMEEFHRKMEMALFVDITKEQKPKGILNQI